jgi:hypothetical protein
VRLPLVVALLAPLAACTTWQHGYTLAEVEGQVLQASVGPGAERLELESRFDPSVRTYVANFGAPDYVYVVSRTQLQLVYLASDELVVFQRSGWSTASRVTARGPVPDALAEHFSPRDRARLAARRGEAPEAGPGAEPAPPGPAEPPAAATLADTVALCRAIQTSPDAPLSCQFTYLEGAPSMFLVFPDAATATAYWQTVSQVVGQPFCDAANAANRQALVVVALAESALARVYACEAAEWSNWFALEGGAWEEEGAGDEEQGERM